MRKVAAAAVMAALFCSWIWLGCGTTGKGAVLGGVAGGAAGALIGDRAGNTAMGALIGAAVGGTAGALIGKHMDQQASDLEKDLKDAKVERVGEGIKVTFGSGILFTSGSSDLQAEGKANIESLAQVLAKYTDTNVLVDGYTDSDGTEELNQKLSEQRAANVAQYMRALGMAGERLTTIGHGESLPVVDNSTPANKQLNRRVEIAIFANDKMKAAAAKGQL